MSSNEGDAPNPHLTQGRPVEMASRSQPVPRPPGRSAQGSGLDPTVAALMRVLPSLLGSLGVGQPDPMTGELVSLLREELKRTHERELYWREVAERGVQFEDVIGNLDRLMSEVVLLAARPRNETDVETLRHHAEDMMTVGKKVLNLIDAAELKSE